jgi:hypothetical protein
MKLLPFLALVLVLVLFGCLGYGIGREVSKHVSKVK